MKFLTEFEFEDFASAMAMHGKIFSLMRKQHYVRYFDLIELGLIKIHNDIPDIYYKFGWSNLFECTIRNNRIIMPPIVNIENKIKMIKESKNEGTNNKNN